MIFHYTIPPWHRKKIAESLLLVQEAARAGDETGHFLSQNRQMALL